MTPCIIVVVFDTLKNIEPAVESSTAGFDCAVPRLLGGCWRYLVVAIGDV